MTPERPLPRRRRLPVAIAFGHGPPPRSLPGRRAVPADQRDDGKNREKLEKLLPSGVCSVGCVNWNDGRGSNVGDVLVGHGDVTVPLLLRLAKSSAS